MVMLTLQVISQSIASVIAKLCRRDSKALHEKSNAKKGWHQNGKTTNEATLLHTIRKLPDSYFNSQANLHRSINPVEYATAYTKQEYTHGA